MTYIYAVLIIKNEKKYSQVPINLKEAVRETLVSLDYKYLAVE